MFTDNQNDPLPAGKVILDANGDPVGEGVKMLEKESYERLIEGLKIMADAAAHLTRTETEHTKEWALSMVVCDRLRKMAMEHARINTIGFKQTVLPDLPMAWANARTRFREGTNQAHGGARQMAVCFRMDTSFSVLAREIENHGMKMLNLAQSKLRQARRTGRLWVPNDGGVN